MSEENYIQCDHVDRVRLNDEVTDMRCDHAGTFAHTFAHGQKDYCEVHHPLLKYVVEFVELRTSDKIRPLFNGLTALEDVRDLSRVASLEMAARIQALEEKSARPWWKFWGRNV